jgi:hypothetical protein
MIREFLQHAAGISSTAQVVWIKLVFWTTSDQGVVSFYQDDLVDKLKLASRTVERAIKELREAGFLDRLHRGTGWTKRGVASLYSRTPSVYRLIPDGSARPVEASETGRVAAPIPF